MRGVCGRGLATDHRRIAFPGSRIFVSKPAISGQPVSAVEQVLSSRSTTRIHDPPCTSISTRFGADHRTRLGMAPRTGGFCAEVVPDVGWAVRVVRGAGAEPTLVMVKKPPTLTTTVELGVSGHREEGAHDRIGIGPLGAVALLQCRWTLCRPPRAGPANYHYVANGMISIRDPLDESPSARTRLSRWIPRLKTAAGGSHRSDVTPRHGTIARRTASSIPRHRPSTRLQSGRTVSVLGRRDSEGRSVARWEMDQHRRD